MHKFLRAIGFSQFDTRKKIQSLVRACVLDSSEKNFTQNGDDTMLAEYCKDFSPYFGIAVCGEIACSIVVSAGMVPLVYSGGRGSDVIAAEAS